MLTTAQVLALPITYYYGPTRDRIPIKEARDQGILYFQVWVSHVFCKIGESGVKGSFLEYEPAEELARSTPHGEVHAIAAPFNHPESMIWSSWWSYESYLKGSQTNL